MLLILPHYRFIVNVIYSLCRLLLVSLWQSCLTYYIFDKGYFSIYCFSYKPEVLR
jgi:hypothetical protein